MNRKGNIISILRRYLTVLIAVPAVLAFCSCRIEPPLHLADGQPVEFVFPELVTDIEVIWGDDIDMEEWWYGWDSDDEALFGALDYPVPRSYEIRLAYFGMEPDGDILSWSTMTIDGSSFRRAYNYGYHDLLAWSNIYSPDHTQVVVIDESDHTNIKATTTETRLRFAVPQRSEFKVYNGPEIFYSGLKPKLYVSKNPEDYDYFDEARNVWVKHLTMDVSPMVYTYLVQVVIYNNNGKIRGISERTAVSSMARGVSLHTGKTSEDDAVVCFDMRMKYEKNARNGRKADIIGGKMTTFGLCGMEPWIRTRADNHYSGTRTDLANGMMLNLQFSNSTDSVYRYDVTPQMRRQAHGGIITIEIDADTITVPTRPMSGSSAGFDPTVNGYSGNITHEFEM